RCPPRLAAPDRHVARAVSVGIERLRARSSRSTASLGLVQRRRITFSATSLGSRCSARLSIVDGFFRMRREVLARFHRNAWVPTRAEIPAKTSRTGRVGSIAPGTTPGPWYGWGAITEITATCLFLDLSVGGAAILF